MRKGGFAPHSDVHLAYGRNLHGFWYPHKVHLYPPPKSQRSPASDQAQSTQRRDRTQHLEPLRVEDEEVYAAAEHRHAGNEERGGGFVLWRDASGQQQDAGVDELDGGYKLAGRVGW